MLDVRVNRSPDPESLVAFVERLAGSGRGGAGVKRARSRVVADVRAGRTPAGLRTLEAALEAPAPEDRPEPATGSLLDAVADAPLTVLSGTATDELGRALAELTRRGMRVLLTGQDAARLTAVTTAVRTALPAGSTGRIVDRMPALDPAELRRLRRHLARLGAAAGADRTGRTVPEDSVLPSAAVIAECCERANHVAEGDAGRTGRERGDAAAVPGMLRGLEDDRRAAVTEVARGVLAALDDFARLPDADGLRGVVGRLVHQGLRSEFENLRHLLARQRDDRRRYARGPTVEQRGPLPAGGDAAIHRYLDFLESGGRGRRRFRSPEQRQAQPALDTFRVPDAGSDYDAVCAIVNHLDLAARDAEIARLCAVLGLNAPSSAAELPGMCRRLDQVAETVRSVGALRHDVLFLQKDSPVIVPDLAAAERVARAIVEYDEHGDPVQAAEELDTFADELEAAVPSGSRTSEHLAAVAALREHDADAYAAALEDLTRARREVADRADLDRLLTELRRGTSGLAAAWTADAEAGTPGFGLLRAVPARTLLTSLPAADAADVVVVLGAGALQADALLLTAAAPRLLAVVGDEARASGTTLVEVLGQASARFLRGTGATGAEHEAAPETGTPETGTPVPAIPAQVSGEPAAAASTATGAESRGAESAGATSAGAAATGATEAMSTGAASAGAVPAQRRPAPARPATTSALAPARKD
ncbi:hypothetical protein [Pseudonocardia phyllosphaerae]|uniref:hypothetical protein n=1 Tax=Pseudonocardia phyllosphaerae TaxID=3390502 RepID=UPI003979E16F